MPEQLLRRKVRACSNPGDVVLDPFGGSGARLFALLTLYLVAWSVAIVVQRLTSQPATVVGPLNAIEDVAAFMLPVTTLNIALVLAVEGPWSRTQQVVLVAA